MSQGYSTNLVAANRQESLRHIGVALGRVCIKKGVPVTDVAAHFHVSRQTVYSWFKGVSHPRPELQKDIERYMNKIGR